MRLTVFAALPLVLACHVNASRVPSPATTLASAADSAAVAGVAGAWWRAFTVGDTAYLKARTAPGARLTLSSGRTFDRAGVLADAVTHRPSATMFVRGIDSVVVNDARGSVIVANRVAEGSQGGENVYRYLTILERDGEGWRVVAAQSTRELGLTRRVTATAAGNLTDFVGSYRAPRGGLIRIAARDSALALIDPSGAEVRLEPIGPALFEVPTLYDGIAVLRFAFARDATGRVSSLSRLIYGSVNTWVRADP